MSKQPPTRKLHPPQSCIASRGLNHIRFILSTCDPLEVCRMYQAGVKNSANAADLLPFYQQLEQAILEAKPLF